MLDQTFKNQTKKFYNLMLDHLLAKHSERRKEEVNKKEIFKSLDCEEILPAFMLSYLIFNSTYGLLSSIFKSYSEIIEGNTKLAIKKIENEVEGEKEQYIEIRKKQKEAEEMLEDFNEIKDQTSRFFFNKLEKNIKRTEEKIGSQNIQELASLHSFFSDLSTQLTTTHQLTPTGINQSVKSLLTKFVNESAKKWRDQIVTIVNNESWQTSPVIPYYQEVLKTINSLDLQDDQFEIAHDENLKESDVLTIGDEEFHIVNTVLQLLYILYEYVRLIRFFKEVSGEAYLLMLDLIKTFNTNTLDLILGSNAYRKQVDGCKNGITCKHLATTSQCLGFMDTEMTFLKEQLLLVADSSEVKKYEMETAQVQSDLQEHKSKLLEKISDVINSASEGTFAEAEKVDWASGKEVKLFKKLVKNLKSVQKQVKPLLPASQINKVFSTILDQIIENMRKY